LVAAFEDDAGRRFVGSSYGQILVGDATGWRLESLGAPLIVTGVWAARGEQPTAVAGNGAFVRDVSGAWRPVTLPVGTSAMLDIWGLDAEHVWIAGTDGIILRRTGGEWQRAATPVTDEVWGIGGTAPDRLVAVGQNGIILSSTDAGATWQREVSPTNRTLFAVAADGAGRVVAVGSAGAVVVWDGSEWRAVASGTTRTLFDVRAAGPGSFIAVGDGGTMLEGDGVAWQLVAVPGVRENLRAVVGAPGQRTAVGWYGAVLTEASGWNTALSGSRLYGVHIPEDGVAMAVGTGGLAYQRVAGVWRAMSLPASASLYAIAGPTADDRLAVGDSGTIRHLSAGGWHAESAPTGALLRSVWYDGVHALAVGADGVALVREGGTWRSVPSGSHRFLRQVEGGRWDNLLVAGDSGTLLRWDGAQFSRVATPVETNLRGIDFSDPDDIWVVGDQGTILRGDGTRWIRQLPPTDADIRAVHRVGGSVYIAGGRGEVHRFGGGGWTALPSDQPGFWLAMAGRAELVLVGEVGIIGEAVR
jgi:hypothetical protein